MTSDMESVRTGQWGGMSRFLRVLLRHPGVDNRLAALGRFVVRQTHKRVVGGPMIVRWEGMQLAVTPDSTAAAAAYYLRRPDWWEFAFIERFLRAGDTVADVGANVGVYTMFMAKRVGPGGRVIACEPDAENAGALHVNVAGNALSQVRLVQAAVGEREGTIGFLSGRRTQSRIGLDAESTDTTARLTTLDALCHDHPPVFVKVDVEGFEDAVVRGAAALMRAGFPKVWQLEVDPQRTAQQARLADALTAYGYACFAWEPHAGALRRRDLNEPGGNNLLAVADLDFVHARTRGPS
jgi:FkbM family methyltransferase